jgi:hypothetical protein
MTEKPFWITSFKSEKNIADNLASAGLKARCAEDILARLSALAAFLEQNRLTTRQLTGADGRVNEDFVFMSNDLTPLGLKLIRKAYVKWQKRAKTPEDVRELEKALSQLQMETSSHTE